MTQNSIIDNVFSKEFKHARKPSAQQILGIKRNNEKGHSRFYSRQFVPFAAERDVKGRLIKQPNESIYNKKHSTLWQLSQDIDSSSPSQNSTTIKAKKSLIDSRFKLHQIDHFRETQIKSHMRSVPEFAKEFQAIQNKDYNRKYKQAKRQEQLWLTNGFKSIELGRDKEHQNPNQQSIFHSTIKGQSMTKFNRTKLTQSLSLGKLTCKPPSQLSHLKPSHKSLFNKKPNRNTQLLEIERNVKVHFNHPELDRLKQSKKLQFKIVENLQYGDRKFKEKIEQYRKIKERIKNEMAKY